MNIMPVMDIVDAQLRLQFLGRDVMLPSAPMMASDLAHDPNTLPVVEALKKPHVLSTYSIHWQPTGSIPSNTNFESSESTSDS